MRTQVFFALTTMALAYTGCGGDGGISGGRKAASQAAIDEAHGVIDELYENEAPDGEKLAATVKFLEAYPESSYTVGLMGDVFYFTGETSHDMKGVVEFAEKIRAAVNDPVIALEFDRRLISWYGDAGMKAEMLTVADRLECDGTIRFGDYFNVIEQAVAMEDWELTRSSCSKARPKATAAAWRAEWPDIEATDERAEIAGLNRQGMLLVKDSWAEANIGDVAGALDGFARAERIVSSSFIGIPAYDLDVYWGRTLMMKGDARGAMERFAPGALIAHDQNAAAGLIQAYTMEHGSEDGFAAWSGREGLAIAKPAADFELPDPGGGRHRFSDLRGEVTLLNFWSPT